MYIADFGNYRIRFINNAALTVGSPFMGGSSISVFPNPSSGLFTIVVRLMQERVVLSNTSASFNVVGYAPGIYLYQVITDSETASGKITIQN